jgi:hypothetical protein
MGEEEGGTRPRIDRADHGNRQARGQAEPAHAQVATLAREKEKK